MVLNFFFFTGATARTIASTSPLLYTHALACSQACYAVNKKCNKRDGTWEKVLAVKEAGVTTLVGILVQQGQWRELIRFVFFSLEI